MDIIIIELLKGFMFSYILGRIKLHEALLEHERARVDNSRSR